MKIKFLLINNYYELKDCMSTSLQIQEIANNSEIRNLRNENHENNFRTYSRFYIMFIMFENKSTFVIVTWTVYPPPPPPPHHHVHHHHHKSIITFLNSEK